MTENYEMKVANKTETHLVGIKIKIMRLLYLHVAQSTSHEIF